MKKVLLYSGGMDSWLIDKIWKPDIKLYVDMNTRYSKEEIKRLPKDVIIEKLDLGKWEREDAIIPLRNLYLIMLATNYGDDICLGATAGDRVLDKSIEFAKNASNLLSFLYSKQHWTDERKININLDFKGYTKKQLIAKYLEIGGDIEEAVKSSFSCYDPIEGKECWECKPCFRKYVSFKVNGYDFGEEIDNKVKNYMKNFIMSDIQEGIYGRGKEEENDILEVYNSI